MKKTSPRGGSTAVLVVTNTLVCLKSSVLGVVDPKHPINYAKKETPPNYICCRCGAAGCKLWREYQTFLDHQTLLCAKCAGKDQKKDVSAIDAAGRYESGDLLGKIDQIGWYVPAVPTEQNDTYWGYTSVPEAGCTWWRNLPTHPVCAPPQRKVRQIRRRPPV